MKDNLDCIAFHEAGHAVAHILAEIPFKYVTILEEKVLDELGQRSLGHIAYEKPKTKDEWDQFSFLDPNEFSIFFKDDFTKLAGFVAEGIYRGKFNYKAAKGDFREWLGTSLGKLPESLNSAYISFMMEYTGQIIHSKTNWSNITAVALALVEEDTLSYERVCEVVAQDRANPVLK